MSHFQIIFNPVSAQELSKMPKDLQLHIIGQFRGLPEQVRKNDLGDFGTLAKGNKRLHRLRLGDYRIYFEMHALGVVVHRILNRHSLKDFLYRSNLPGGGEDKALEDNPKFWEMIETQSTTA